MRPAWAALFALASAACGRSASAPVPEVATTAAGGAPTAATVPGVPPASVSTPAASAAPSTPRAVDVAVGANRACVVVEGGRVACFSTTAAPPRIARFVAGLPPASALAVAVGQLHACILRDDRTVACWGSNARGELGTASSSDGPPPLPVAGLTRVASIDLVWATSFAVDEDGAAWGWGAPDAGVLASASTDDHRVPVRLRGLPPISGIAGGGRHACGLARTGDVFCWGSNATGELAGAAPSERRAPTRVAGLSRVVAIGAGTQRSCALLAEGRVSCWGLVGYATPGARQTRYTRPPDMPPYADSPDPDHYTVTWNPVPTTVPGVEGALELASGADVDCVRDARGALCWSAGGHGPGPGALAPTRLPLSAVTRVAAGEHFACAVDSAGAVTCFSVQGGQLGPAQVVSFGP